MKTQLNNYELSSGLSAHSPLKFKNEKVSVLSSLYYSTVMWFEVAVLQSKALCLHSKIICIYELHIQFPYT